MIAVRNIAAVFFSAVLIFIVASFLLPSFTHALDCGPGKRPTTADDVAKGLPANSCTDEKTAEDLNGGCDYNPYLVLEKYKNSARVKISPRAGAPGTNSLQEGIDSALACRLSKLVQWAVQQGCTPKITDGFRNEEDQAQACKSVCGNPAGCPRGCAPPGGSCHQYGLAVDMPSNCTAKLAAVAGQFGLRGGTAGYPNPIHFQCIEQTTASCNKSTPSCKGGLKINPTPSTGAPFDSTIRKFLSPQPQASWQPTPVPSLNTQIPQINAATQSDCPMRQYYCSGNAIRLFCQVGQDTVVQNCPNGCSGTTCNPAPQTPQNLDGSSPLSVTNTGTPPKSTVDILSALAQGTTTKATTTAAVSPFNSSTAAQIQQQGSALAPDSAPPGVQFTSPTGSISPSGIVQQTFPDGNTNPSPTTFPQTSVTGFQNALAAIAGTLRQMLTYLQPFGGRAFNQNGFVE